MDSLILQRLGFLYSVVDQNDQKEICKAWTTTMLRCYAEMLPVVRCAVHGADRPAGRRGQEIF